MALLTPDHFYQDTLAYKGRLIAFDVGTKTLGIAITDRSLTLGSPLKTLHRSTWAHDVPHIKAILQDYNIMGGIVGWPVHMDGTPGARCEMVQKWAEKLLTFIDLPLCFWDERLSTAAATDTLLQASLSRKRRKELVDKVAASYILKSFLEHYPYTF